MNWSVGTKIAGGFALALLVLVAVGATSYLSTRKLVDASQVVTHTHLVLEDVHDVLSLLKDAETGQRGFLLTGRESYLEPYNAAVRGLDQKLFRLRDLTKDNPNQKPRIDRLEGLVATKRAELQETIDLRRGKGVPSAEGATTRAAGPVSPAAATGTEDAGFRAALQTVLSDRGKNVMDDVRGVVADMEKEERDLLDRRASEAESSARAATWTILAGIPVAVLLVAAAGLLITRNIAAPLRRITGAAERIAAGDLAAGELAVAANVDGRTDEVGMLGRAFARMTAALQETAGVAGRIAGGDLAVAVRPQSDRDLLGNAFAAMVDGLRRVTADITEGATVLGSSASEIVASTSQLASGAAQTATAVAETTTTVEEVRQTAQVASQKARLVSDTAQRTVAVAQDGKRSTAETAGGMGRIRDQMGSIASSMVRLGEQTQAIGQIIATVDDLAQQSNLLAVNASIEAAKAGDQGKGFAVVAQEVKSLAEQSRAATTQVRQILADIQKATAAAALATDQGAKAVDAGLAQSARAGESILALADGVNEAAQAASQIAASSQQQLVGMDQVAQAMESIKQASTQNVDSAKQLEAAARSLDDLGRRLKELVGRYKV